MKVQQRSENLIPAHLTFTLCNLMTPVKNPHFVILPAFSASQLVPVHFEQLALLSSVFTPLECVAHDDSCKTFLFVPFVSLRCLALRKSVPLVPSTLLCSLSALL